jgi:hypothetical protein
LGNNYNSHYNLGKVNADTVFDFLINKLQAKEKVINRICALWLLRHMIVREFYNISENLRKMFMSYLQNLVYD